MKRTRFHRSLALSAALACLLCLAACGGQNTASSSPAAPLEYTVSCQNNRGDSAPFDIHSNGTVSLSFTNNGLEDVFITVHKQGLLNRWGGAVSVNGCDSFSVPVGQSVQIDTDGSAWSKGTYRFQASNDTGTDFDYACTMQELDYIP